MSYIGSYWTRGVQSANSSDANINAAVQNAIQTAAIEFSPLQFEGEYPKTGFGITTLRPKDLALSNQTSGIQSSVQSSIVWGPISVTTASAWSEWINIPVDSRIYVVITGLFYVENAPNITALRFKANGEDLPVMDIEELTSYDVSFMFLEKPVTIKAGNNITIRYVAKNAKAAPENMGLLGYTIAKRAYLITE